MKIHILHTVEVCVSPALPFGGAHCNVIKASGIFTKKKDRLWLPVTCYLIEYDGRNQHPLTFRGPMCGESLQ